MQFIDNKPNAIATICSTIFIIAGSILSLIGYSYDYIIFGIGALIAIVQSFIIAYKNRTNDIRIGRLHRINFITSLTLGIGAYMMYVHSNSWVVMLILYAVLTIFLAIRWK